MPTISFLGDEKKLYKRFYTKYFSENHADSSLNIASYSFANRENWIETIRNWRKPILDNK